MSSSKPIHQNIVVNADWSHFMGSMNKNAAFVTQRDVGPQDAGNQAPPND
jgi:hypothetical protein